MRIIDKNHDFYDYLQDPTDSNLVFDRRGSYSLEKKHLCEAMRYNFDETNSVLIELQCGITFWVFLATITEFDTTYHIVGRPFDFDLELLATWKNHQRPNKLLDINVLKAESRWDFKSRTYQIDKESLMPESIHDLFEQYGGFGEMKPFKLVNYIESKNGYDKKEYTYPLLYSTDIAKLISPVDMFCAIEEYFSIEKTRAEKTEPVGATNDDKIIMHGFDTKTSFRGKNKQLP